METKRLEVERMALNESLIIRECTIVGLLVDGIYKQK